jgi:selenide,water dikinase
MVPGYVAGHYSRGEINIRVNHLADFEGCAAVFQRAVELEANTRRVDLADGSSICGDIISIDVGARALLNAATGHHAMIVPAKPMDDFERGWAELEPRLQSDEDLSFGIVGGGAAGVELALAIRYRLGRSPTGSRCAARVVLLERNHEILQGFAASAEAPDPHSLGPWHRDPDGRRWQRRRGAGPGIFRADCGGRRAPSGLAFQIWTGDG